MIKTFLLAFPVLALAACGGGSAINPASNLQDAPPIVAGGDTSPVSGGPVTTPQDANFGRMLNEYRLTSGVGTLTFDPLLEQAAEAHSQDMLKRDYFAHESPEGDGVHERILATGYKPTAWAETLGIGHQSDASILQGWKDSPPHDAALKGKSLEEFGLAVAGTGSKTRWTLVMATPQK
jgi:uncharacterized protein YkwD